MKTKKIKETDLRNLIGCGAEGRVFLLENGDACKIFYDGTQIENKIKKLKFIKDLEMYNIANPKEIVTMDKKIVGYTMDYILYDDKLNRYLESDHPLDYKIEYLKQLEDLMKELHFNNITMVDTMYHNFLISNENLYGIDVDNYYVNGLKNNVAPFAVYDLYIDNVSTKINSDLDKFYNLIFMLHHLFENSFELETIYKNYDYLKKFVNSLIITKNLKELFLEILSDSVNKPYLEDEIDELLEYDDTYIKRKIL